MGILGASIMPASALAKTPELFPQQDKVLHILMYGGWTVLLGWALQRRMRNRPAKWMAGIVLLATAYGALMEGLQGILICIHRTCSWGDMLANLAGAVLGVGLLALFARPRLCLINAGCPPRRPAAGQPRRPSAGQVAPLPQTGEATLPQTWQAAWQPKKDVHHEANEAHEGSAQSINP